MPLIIHDEVYVARLEKGMLSWFGYLERMDERFTQQIYMGSVEGRVGRGRYRRTFDIAFRQPSSSSLHFVKDLLILGLPVRGHHLRTFWSQGSSVHQDKLCLLRLESGDSSSCMSPLPFYAYGNTLLSYVLVLSARA